MTTTRLTFTRAYFTKECSLLSPQKIKWFFRFFFKKLPPQLYVFRKNKVVNWCTLSDQKKYQDEVSETILCLLTQKLSIICHFIQLASIKRKCLSWQHNDNFHKSGSFVFVCITTSTFISLLKSLQMSHHFNVKYLWTKESKWRVLRCCKKWPLKTEQLPRITLLECKSHNGFDSLDFSLDIQFCNVYWQTRFLPFVMHNLVSEGVVLKTFSLIA